MGDTLTSILIASRGSQAPKAPAASEGFSASAVVSTLLEGPQGIGAQLSVAQRAELQSLAKERDQELFWRGMISFGGTLENAEKFEAAAQLYATVVGAQHVEPLRADAQSRLDAILGKGAFSPRFEFLLKRFAKDASDPKMIVPMLAGTAVYGLARTAALGRLTAGARGAWYTQGFGPRFAASSLGYVAEVPTFALTSRALRQMGSDGKTPQPGLDHELASAAITLGLLKGFGFAGQQGFARLHGFAEAGTATRLAGWTRLTQPAFSHGAMFSGLLSAHKIEENLGLRPHVDGATTVTDTLASMFSLGIGARLGHHALGPRFAAFQREMELRGGLALLQSQSPQIARTSFSSPSRLAPAYGRLTAMATGLSAFLPERLAFAQGTGGASGASSSEAVLMTWVSTAIVGGLLFWGGKKIRDHYVAPSGRIAELIGFRSQLEAAKPEQLLAQVQKAERYLKESQDYRRKNDEEIAVEAYNFLGQALPKLSPEQRLASLGKLWDQLGEVGDHNRHLILRVIRKTISSLNPEGIERLAFRAKQGLRYEDFDRVLNFLFVSMMLLSQRSADKRVETAVAIHQAIAGRETQLTAHLDWINKGRILLKGMKEFMDQRAAEEKQKIRQKIRELKTSQEGDSSTLDLSLKAREKRLEDELKNYRDGEEIDIINAYLKHLREKEEEIPMMWDHRLALDYALKFQEAFGEAEGAPMPATVSPNLRARLDAAHLYLKDGGLWLRQLYPRPLLEEIDRYLAPADRANSESGEN